MGATLAAEHLPAAPSCSGAIIPTGTPAVDSALPRAVAIVAAPEGPISAVLSLPLRAAAAFSSGTARFLSRMLIGVQACVVQCNALIRNDVLGSAQDRLPVPWMLPDAADLPSLPPPKPPPAPASCSNPCKYSTCANFLNFAQITCRELQFFG
eukprot:CAMPEP_0119387510 /NCGR_PEP_ID=MMETSP1334-20130426/100976_1 /TAXON_ID=127549 /ORGANISM="Calcidiscus leptoporus, Strain RCC1130" /LENGTH=152 /DNA_ID=CAMNT_0007409267 /DNA_START=211 /DNA_END=666 /DNA_ORIENTATION=+